MNENRGPWYLLTGLVIGAVLGLLYAWVVHPVEYVDTSPSSLQSRFKDQYRVLIAYAFTANGDLVRARARLELLNDQDIYRALAEQAQRTLAGGGSSQEAKALGILAVALGQEGQSQLITPLAVSATPDATPQPPQPTAAESTQTLAPTSIQPENTATSLPPAEAITETMQPSTTFTETLAARALRTQEGTPQPTPTATATPGGPFTLKNQQKVCDPKWGKALIQVLTLDAAEQPVPGIGFIVTWEGGEEVFFTGLKPEFGPGYADFTMSPGITYTIRLADGGQPIPGLAAFECTPEGQAPFPGAWQLVFIQP